MRIVLAYSGGLETSVAIPWLAEKYRAEIVTVTMDLGQGKELDDVRQRALASGALRAHVLDLREEFARDFVLPALQAGAVYEGRYPLATALAWLRLPAPSAATTRSSLYAARQPTRQQLPSASARCAEPGDSWTA